MITLKSNDPWYTGNIRKAKQGCRKAKKQGDNPSADVQEKV